LVHLQSLQEKNTKKFIPRIRDNLGSVQAQIKKYTIKLYSRPKEPCISYYIADENVSMLSFFFFPISTDILHVDRYVASTTGRSHALGAHPGIRSAHSSRTSSAASTPILRHRSNQHRHHQIIRFNTRRLIIFHQRITNQHHNNQQQQSTAEIPLVHRDNLLTVPVNNQNAHHHHHHHPAAASGTAHLLLAHRQTLCHSAPNSVDSSAQMDAAHHMLCMDQEVSESSQTKNTSVMMSYL
jgi:hypothetical protein